MKKRKVGELYGHPIVDGYESLTLKHEIHIDDLLKQGGSQGGNTSKWTGHADVKGLKAIGWDDDDIAYYQEHGVNWNEEDDKYHKVSEDNKALYGVLTAENISKYKERIVYLPKIDTSGKTNMDGMFGSCNSLVFIPQLNTSRVTSMASMFYECKNLVGISKLDTSNVTEMSMMFGSCYSLVTIPQLNTSKVTNMLNMFNKCHSLVTIPQLDTSSVKSMGSIFTSCYSLVNIPQLDTNNVTNMYNMFNSCYSLVSIPKLDTSKITNTTYMFSNCFSLVTVNLKNAAMAYQLDNSALLSKESLLYLINNEAATSAITIKLATYAYTRLSTDPDIVAALAAHPNISLTK